MESSTFYEHCCFCCVVALLIVVVYTDDVVDDYGDGTDVVFVDVIVALHSLTYTKLVRVRIESKHFIIDVKPMQE